MNNFKVGDRVYINKEDGGGTVVKAGLNGNGSPWVKVEWDSDGFFGMYSNSQELKLIDYPEQPNNVNEEQLDKFLNGYADFINNLSDEEWEKLDEDDVQDFFDSCADSLPNKIKELADQAEKYALYIRGYCNHNDFNITRDTKFAELIAKECTSLIDAGDPDNQLFTDANYNKGYYDGRRDAVDIIKKHFGIEE